MPDVETCVKRPLVDHDDRRRDEQRRRDGLECNEWLKIFFMVGVLAILLFVLMPYTYHSSCPETICDVCATPVCPQVVCATAVCPQVVCPQAERPLGSFVRVEMWVPLDDASPRDYRCDVSVSVEADADWPAWFDESELCPAMRKSFQSVVMADVAGTTPMRRFIHLASARQQKPWIDAATLIESPKGNYACWIMSPRIIVDPQSDGNVRITAEKGLMSVESKLSWVSSTHRTGFRCFVSSEYITIDRLEVLAMESIYPKVSHETMTLAAHSAHQQTYVGDLPYPHPVQCACVGEPSIFFDVRKSGEVPRMRLDRVDDVTDELTLELVDDLYIQCTAERAKCFAMRVA